MTNNTPDYEDNLYFDSQDTKNEQLTEKWKKGELPEGHYYIKTHNETTIDEYIQWYKDHGIPSEKSFAYFNVQQVLAPVPTFDEWQAKLEENTKLKEVLKECRNSLEEQSNVRKLYESDVEYRDRYNEEESGRTMTLLKAIEQIEKLECELERKEKQLAIAVEALGVIINNGDAYWDKTQASKYLQEIEELEK